MDEKAHFLKFWKKEADATRKVLSRIPEGSTYRPDPKSRTAREIAWLMVRALMSRCNESGIRATTDNQRVRRAGKMQGVQTPAMISIGEASRESRKPRAESR